MPAIANAEPRGYKEACGRRLRIAREALSYSNRSAFVRLLTGDDGASEDFDRLLAKLEKWEDGSVLVRPWFVDHLKDLFGITHCYIFSGDKSSLQPEFAVKISRLEQIEQAA